jgi:hypothetical protein
VLVCNWPHFVGQNHLYVKMLFIRDSAIHKCSRRFYTISMSKILIPCQPSGRLVFPSERPVVQSFSCLNAHQAKASSVQTTWIPFWTFLCVEKLQTAPVSILPDVSVARSNDSLCSTKLHIFFPKANMGRLPQPFGQRGALLLKASL